MRKFSHLGFIGDEAGAKFEDQWRWAVEQAVRPTGIELRTVNGQPLYLLNKNEVQGIAEVLRDKGLAVHCLASGFGKFTMPTDPAAKVAAIATQMGMLRILGAYAGILGTRLIRGFALRRDGDVPSMWPAVVAFFRQALEILPEGISLAIENEAATACATLGDVARLRHALGSNRRIMAILDPGNYVYEPGLMHATRHHWSVTNLVLHDILERHGIIALVHAKSCELCGPGLMEARTVPLGQGSLDYHNILATLASAGFDGPIDIEPHRSPTGAQLAETTRWMPGGEGYGSFEACTEDWETLLRFLAA